MKLINCPTCKGKGYLQRINFISEGITIIEGFWCRDCRGKGKIKSPPKPPLNKT